MQKDESISSLETAITQLYGTEDLVQEANRLRIDKLVNALYGTRQGQCTAIIYLPLTDIEESIASIFIFVISYLTNIPLFAFSLSMVFIAGNVPEEYNVLTKELQ